MLNHEERPSASFRRAAAVAACLVLVVSWGCDETVDSSEVGAPPGEDAAGSDSPSVPGKGHGTCDSPVAVLAPGIDLFDLGSNGVSLETITTGSAATAADSCFLVEGPVGTSVLSLDLPRPGYLSLSVETQSAGFTKYATVRRDDCHGPIIACWSSPPGALFDFGQDVPAGRITIEVVLGSDGLQSVEDVAVDVWIAADGTEDCDDGIDNDMDDSVDCLDPVCFFDPVCYGGHLGEDCADAIPIPAGLNVDDRVAGHLYSTLSGRMQDITVPESCLPNSRFTGDVFFSYTSEHGASVSAYAYAFSDGTLPPRWFLPVMVVSGGCDKPPASCHDPATAAPGDYYTTAEVSAGTAYIVVRPPDLWPPSLYEPSFTLQFVITPFPPP